MVIFALCVAFTFREGMWGNAIRLVNLVTAGLIAMNFFEPAAKFLEEQVESSLTYFWDFMALWAIFCVTLLLLRLLTDYTVSRVKVRFLNAADRWGGIVFGVFCGWFMVCFTTASLHTAPLARNFLYDGFKVPEGQPVRTEPLRLGARLAVARVCTLRFQWGLLPGHSPTRKPAPAATGRVKKWPCSTAGSSQRRRRSSTGMPVAATPSRPWRPRAASASPTPFPNDKEGRHSCLPKGVQPWPLGPAVRCSRRRPPKAEVAQYRPLCGVGGGGDAGRHVVGLGDLRPAVLVSAGAGDRAQRRRLAADRGIRPALGGPHRGAGRPGLVVGLCGRRADGFSVLSLEHPPGSSPVRPPLFRLPGKGQAGDSPASSTRPPRPASRCWRTRSGAPIRRAPTSRVMLEGIVAQRRSVPS